MDTASSEAVRAVSKGDLLDAYVTGAIGRRAFIRAMVSLGVPLDAAAAHAVALKSGSGSTGEDEGDADDGATDDDRGADQTVRPQAGPPA